MKPFIAEMSTESSVKQPTLPDATGHFGPYGGVYVPETLMTALQELGEVYAEARKDPSYESKLAWHLKEFAGRPTELYFAERMTGILGGAKVYFKREDLLHTGAHKINNVIGQALLGWGKSELLLRQEPGNTGSRQQPLVRNLAWSV